MIRDRGGQRLSPITKQGECQDTMGKEVKFHRKVRGDALGKEVIGDLLSVSVGGSHICRCLESQAASVGPACEV